jgi:hypothetical protein
MKRLAAKGVVGTDAEFAVFISDGGKAADGLRRLPAFYVFCTLG